jgi:hypothetical protein
VDRSVEHIGSLGSPCHMTASSEVITPRGKRKRRRKGREGKGRQR